MNTTTLLNKMPYVPFHIITNERRKICGEFEQQRTCESDAFKTEDGIYCECVKCGCRVGVTNAKFQIVIPIAVMHERVLKENELMQEGDYIKYMFKGALQPMYLDERCIEKKASMIPLESVYRLSNGPSIKTQSRIPDRPGYWWVRNVWDNGKTHTAWRPVLVDMFNDEDPTITPIYVEFRGSTNISVNDHQFEDRDMQWGGPCVKQ